MTRANLMLALATFIFLSEGANTMELVLEGKRGTYKQCLEVLSMYLITDTYYKTAKKSIFNYRYMCCLFLRKCHY